MAEGDLIVKMMSQGEAQVYDSVMKLAAAWSKTDDATKKAGDEARKVGKEEAELGRQAARVREEMLTPLDRYTKKVGELDNLLKRGKLTQDEHTAAVRHAKTALDDASAAGHKAFGAESLAMIGRFVGGIVSVGTAVKVATSYLNDMKAASETAAQKGLAAEGGMARLAMLAEGKPELYKQLTGKAREFYAAGAAPNLESAAETVFLLQSMDALDQSETLKKLGATKLIRDVGATAMAAKTLQESMGAKETGSIDEILAKGFAGQAKAPITAEQLVVATARGAVGAGMMGLSDEELMAATARATKLAARATPEEKATVAGNQVARLMFSLAKITAGQSAEGGEGAPSVSLEEAFGMGGLDEEALTPEQAFEAGTDFTGLGIGKAMGLGAKGKRGGLTPQQIAKIKGLRGKSLEEMMLGLKGMNLDEATMMKLLGGSERGGIQAYHVLTKDMEAYKDTLAAIRGGQKGEAMRASMGMVETEMAPQIAYRQLQAEQELSEEQRGRVYLLGKAMQTEFDLKMKKAGYGRGTRWTFKKLDDFYKWLGDEETYVKEMYGTASPGLRKKIDAVMEWEGGPPAGVTREGYGFKGSTGAPSYYHESGQQAIRRYEEKVGWEPGPQESTDGEHGEKRLIEAADKLNLAADKILEGYQPSPTMAGRDQ